MTADTSAAILKAVTRESLVQIPPPSERDIYVHYLIPALTLADWLLFEPKGKFKKYDPLLWLIPTLTYFLTTIFKS